MDEVTALRSQTKAFIDKDPSTIALIAVTQTSDGKGGKKRSWPVANIKLGQVFRLIPRSSTNDRVRQVNGSDGKLSVVEFVLLGEHDSDMERFDRFSLDGEEYEIADIHRSTSDYQRKGDVIRVG